MQESHSYLLMIHIRQICGPDHKSQCIRNHQNTVFPTALPNEHTRKRVVRLITAERCVRFQKLPLHGHVCNEILIIDPCEGYGFQDSVRLSFGQHVKTEEIFDPRGIDYEISESCQSASIHLIRNRMTSLNPDRPKYRVSALTVGSLSFGFRKCCSPSRVKDTVANLTFMLVDILSTISGTCSQVVDPLRD